MYTAVRVPAGPVGFVRVALSLAAVDERVARVQRMALAGLGAGLAVAALS